MQIRGRSDKYFTSPPEGATIARKIYYCVVYSRRRLMSNFQLNRTRNFVLIVCGREGYYKNGKRANRSVIRFLFLEGKSCSEIKQRVDAVYLRLRSSKIGLTSFNVVTRRFLMSHAQVLRNRLLRRIT